MRLVIGAVNLRNNVLFYLKMTSCRTPKMSRGFLPFQNSQLVEVTRRDLISPYPNPLAFYWTLGVDERRTTSLARPSVSVTSWDDDLSLFCSASMQFRDCSLTPPFSVKTTKILQINTAVSLTKPDG